MQARSQQTGFSLLEAIVCLTIMAMMFTVVFQSFSGSLRAVRVGEEYSQATIMAQGKLAELLTAPELTESTLRGEISLAGPDQVNEAALYEWRSEAVRYESDAIGDLDSDLLTLFKVTVEVSWQSGSQRRSTSLTSLKIVPAS